MLNTENYRFEKMVVFAADDPEAFRDFITTGLPIAEGVGLADGKQEPIFITDWASMGLIAMLGFVEGQDTLMILNEQEPVSNGNRSAYLLDKNGNKTPLGILRMVPEAEALAGKAWSQFDGNYWVASGAEELPTVAACLSLAQIDKALRGEAEERAEGFDIPGAQPLPPPVDGLVEELQTVFGDRVVVLDSPEAVDAFFDNAELGMNDPHIGGTRILSTGCTGKVLKLGDTMRTIPIYGDPDFHMPTNAVEQNAMEAEGRRREGLFGNTTAIPTVGVDPASVDPMQSAVDQRIASIELDVAALRTLVDLLEKVIKVTHYGAYHQAKHNPLSVG